MRRLYLLIGSVFFLAAPQFAFADTACPTGSLNFLCFQASDLGKIIGSFITFGFVLVALVALGWLVWGGFKWLISQGEKEAVEEARNHIVNALIGIVVIFLSYLIVNVLLGFLTRGAVSLNNFNIPQFGQ